MYTHTTYKFHSHITKLPLRFIPLDLFTVSMWISLIGTIGVCVSVCLGTSGESECPESRLTGELGTGSGGGVGKSTSTSSSGMFTSANLFLT